MDVMKLQEENEKLKAEVETLKKTMNSIMMSRGTTEFCIEYWVVEDQIDPHLLIRNADECYEKISNRWVLKED